MPLLGRTHYTIGLISGGVAPNVVSPSAEAEVMFRTVSDGSEVRTAVRPLESRVAIDHVLEASPVRMTTVPGYEAVVFPYTTDIPFLSAWGEPLLFGPGLDSCRPHRRRIHLDSRARSRRSRTT